jgi:small multidrug resistance pump
MSRHGERGVAYLYLMIAIVGEVIGTAALKASDGFTRLTPSLITLTGYAAAFYFLALVLKSIPVGIAYAVWSGVGIVLIALIGYFWFRQPLDWPGVLGIALITAGILIVNLFSKSFAH